MAHNQPIKYVLNKLQTILTTTDGEPYLTKTLRISALVTNRLKQGEDYPHGGEASKKKKKNFTFLAL